MKARIRLQKDCIISPIDPRVFGSFIEHLGRAVYTGIYEPGHPTADAFGFRGDVDELIRPLHVTQIRYPSGNFLSGYDWRDGIGPKDKRPVRPDMAWSAIEPNQVGTDEFLQWCERIGAQPMMAVNLGTGTPKDAAELLEYCNGDMHTYWADKRRENGREARSAAGAAPAGPPRRGAQSGPAAVCGAAASFLWFSFVFSVVYDS